MAKKSSTPSTRSAAEAKRREPVQVTTQNRRDVQAYNASQSAPRPQSIPLGGSGSGGAGILSSRGAGAGGGSGSGGSSGGGSPLAAYREDDGRRVFKATPAGTFARPGNTAAPLRLEDSLKTYGSYSPGVMTTKDALSPARRAEWDAANGQPVGLRDILRATMVANPRRSGMSVPMIAAYESMRNGAPSERLQAAVGSAQAQMEEEGARREAAQERRSQRAAANPAATSAFRGLPGVGQGTVNGRRVAIPIAGQRDAYQNTMGQLGADPNDVNDLGGVGRSYDKQLAASAAQQRATEMREFAKKRASEDAKYRSAEEVARITAGGKTGKNRDADMESTRKQLGAARAQFGKEYDDKVANIDRDARITVDRDITLSGSGPEERAAAYEKARQDIIASGNLAAGRDAYVANRAKETFSGALGKTKGYEYRQGVANEIFPGLFGKPADNQKPEFPSEVYSRAGLTPAPPKPGGPQTPAGAPRRNAQLGSRGGAPSIQPSPGPQPPMVTTEEEATATGQAAANALARAGIQPTQPAPPMAPSPSPTPSPDLSAAPILNQRGEDISPPSDRELASMYPADLATAAQQLEAYAMSGQFPQDISAAYLVAAQKAKAILSDRPENRAPPAYARER